MADIPMTEAVIIDCFKPDEKLTNALYDSFAAYDQGDNETGDAKFAETKPLYEVALSDCGTRAD